MKKLIFTLPVILLLAVGCQSQTNNTGQPNVDPRSKSQVKQPNLTINSDFKSIPKDFVCSNNKDCEGKIRPDCFKCPTGTKLVAQWNCEPRFILAGNDSDGVCADSTPGYDEFIHGGCYSYTAFCIVESQGYSIFTKDISDKHYFELWKETLLKTNDISEKYFREHFGNFYFYRDVSSEGTKSRIFYTFYLDWVELKLSDDFLIEETQQDNLGIGLADEIILANLKNYFETKRKINPAQNIISFKEALEIMKTDCHKNAYSENKLDNFYQQKYVDINDTGDLILKGTAEGEDIKTIGVNLIDGKLIYCKDEYFSR